MIAKKWSEKSPNKKINRVVIKAVDITVTNVFLEAGIFNEYINPPNIGTAPKTGIAGISDALTLFSKPKRLFGCP